MCFAHVIAVLVRNAMSIGVTSLIQEDARCHTEKAPAVSAGTLMCSIFLARKGEKLYEWRDKS